MSIVDWIGFIGVFQILLAYFLNVIGKIKSEDLSFILLNLIGACLASILLKYIPFIILEAIWAFVSLISLVKYLKQKHQIKNEGIRINKRNDT